MLHRQFGQRITHHPAGGQVVLRARAKLGKLHVWRIACVYVIGIPVPYSVLFCFRAQ